MNDKLWTIEMGNGKTEQVTCEVCGVAQDGSLIAFLIKTDGSNQPEAIKGWAPGEWTKFSRSSLRMN